MWASHTLVAYPEVKSAGIDRRRAVGVSLAATVITDVLALVVLALGTSSSALVAAPELAGRVASGSVQTTTTVPLWVGLLLLVVVCFVVIPRTTRWLFAHVLHRRTQRFVWTLVAMAAGHRAPNELGRVVTERLCACPSRCRAGDAVHNRACSPA